jgi:hypothetical protein
MKMGQYSVVSIMTYYGMDSVGIKSWSGRDFACASTPAHLAYCTMANRSLTWR